MNCGGKLFLQLSSHQTVWSPARNIVSSDEKSFSLDVFEHYQNKKAEEIRSIQCGWQNEESGFDDPFKS